MTLNDQTYTYYLAVLKKELISATGCTEPIAIALASAKAKEILGQMPTKVVVEVSENIIKNAKSVVVPNTDQLKGIDVAASAGIVVGKSIKQLDVISEVTAAQKVEIKTYAANTDITIKRLHTEYIFDVQITVYAKSDVAQVRMINHHTNIVYIRKNDDLLLAKDYVHDDPVNDSHKDDLTVDAIYDFAQMVKIRDVKALLDAQIKNNMAIAQEGLDYNYGANIGSVIKKHYGEDIKHIAKAYAAAASDARMSGSKLPVTIVSGSGNQGITSSVPVIKYAAYLDVSDDTLYRALVLSNLLTIHQKAGIGKLSAYCGAVFAGASSGAAITYLHGGSLNMIKHTIVNTLAIVSGIICDGAKPSCAAKIASSVEAGILAHHMVLEGEEFLGGDGIIAKGIENTLKNITRLAKDGMRETDQEIVSIMTGKAR
ncbi:MAG: serine dehydratase subunit alpha family protein [Bacillota bacterium]